MRVALIHYWLVSMRGGEKVLEALCELFPDAVIFTHVHDPAAISATINAHEIRASFIQRLPNPRRNYRRYLPLMPFALEALDLSGFDLIISSESGPAKGIRPPKNAFHLCYCHSPMRYLWSHYDEYRRGADLATRLLMPLLTPPLRRWDRATASRVDHFVANSAAVAERIRRYWGREAEVIHPPVDIEAFGPPTEPEDFYLAAGELVGYKRFDLAIEACNRLRRPLVVIGKGPEEARLRKLAGPTVTFLGHVPFDVLADHLRRCKALLFPQEEDFGILAVEAMASGRPVIAHARGGALETVREGESGVFFQEHSVNSLAEAMLRSETVPFDSNMIQNKAQKFGKTHFVNAIARLLAARGLVTRASGISQNAKEAYPAS